ncbi:hypothetical protein MANY_31240 [Mycolicibacterium anyangense]|uniref:Uncharacterized protein n=1 Tax=Mycolicibacterium anyangense TaxID=1431246 RepID=A0A6N4WC60_9MYCO|nr:hypothetical protein MANY_31240 [Mycolicibacterium anyangense]
MGSEALSHLSLPLAVLDFSSAGAHPASASSAVDAATVIMTNPLRMGGIIAHCGPRRQKSDQCVSPDGRRDGAAPEPSILVGLNQGLGGRVAAWNSPARSGRR